LCRSPCAQSLRADLVLKTLNLLPRLQPPSNRAEIERFDEERALIHAEKNFACNFLVPEDFTVMLLHAHRKEIFGDLVWIP
jgi:hypothetical protein